MSRWRHVARAIGLHHMTTRDGVINAFVALDVGQICTEKRRAESERVLRAQPFIADATVRAIPDGPDGVAVTIETTDEVPVLVSGAFRGITPRALSLGNSNVGGLGLLLQGGIERGDNYPNAFGVRIAEYAAFGRPYTMSFDGDRYQVGQRVRVGLEHPFFTDLQRIGWHAGYLTSHDYPRLRRPANDELAIGVHQERREGSTIGRLFGTRTVTLVGAGVSSLRFTPDTAGVVIGPNGLEPDTGITLRNRYRSIRVTRLGGLAGVRRVSFRTVHGFDALTATQDVADGVFTGLFVAKGIPSMGESDLFLSGVAYAGTGGENVFVGAYAQAEGRQAQGASYWDGIVGSGRGALYLGGGPGWMLMVDDAVSGGRRPLVPHQLTLGDRDGGILGYYNTALAGAYRNVARSELRWSGAALVRNADVGVATFTQVGTLWAGDAPYGVHVTRATVGVSLLAAYPTRSKRMYRADVGIPLTRGGTGGGKIEVRFTSEDRTQQFWREPDDVLRARTGPLPASLFAWPVR